jgi:hypothetical protein
MKPIPINRKVMTLSEMDFLVLLLGAARNQAARSLDFSVAQAIDDEVHAIVARIVAKE